jgi:hypothetical protein
VSLWRAALGVRVSAWNLQVGYYDRQMKINFERKRDETSKKNHGGIFMTVAGILLWRMGQSKVRGVEKLVWVDFLADNAAKNVKSEKFGEFLKKSVTNRGVGCTQL